MPTLYSRWQVRVYTEGTGTRCVFVRSQQLGLARNWDETKILRRK